MGARAHLFGHKIIVEAVPVAEFTVSRIGAGDPNDLGTKLPEFFVQPIDVGADIARHRYFGWGARFAECVLHGDNHERRRLGIE